MRDFEKRDFTDMLRHLVEGVSKARPRPDDGSQPMADKPASEPDEFKNDWKPSAAGTVSQKDIETSEGDLAGMLSKFEKKWDEMKDSMTAKLKLISDDFATFRRLAQPILEKTATPVSDEEAQAGLDQELGQVDSERIGLAQKRRGSKSDIRSKVVKSLGHDDILGMSGADVAGKASGVTDGNPDVSPAELAAAQKGDLSLRSKRYLGKQGKLRDRSQPEETK